MFSSIKSCGVSGVGGYGVSVEVFISNGLPGFELVGLPDAAVKEARERVRAAIKNSAVFKKIAEEFGSFSSYIWSFTGGEIVCEEFTLRTTSALSDAVSADLKRRGMTFVGSTIVYSYLQAIGIINGHEKGCDFYCRCPGKTT